MDSAYIFLVCSLVQRSIYFYIVWSCNGS